MKAKLNIDIEAYEGFIKKDAIVETLTKEPYMNVYGNQMMHICSLNGGRTVEIPVLALTLLDSPSSISINWEQRKWGVYKDTITTEWNGVPSDKGALESALRTAKAAVEFYKNNI